MFNLEAIETYFTIILGFIGIGAVLDTVSSKYRENSDFANHDVSYNRVLQTFYSSFYERLFPGSPLSGKYIFNTFVVAVLILISTTPLLYAVADAELTVSRNGWSFNISFFIFYLLVFWLVSAQTKLFVQESLKTSSRLSKAVFIVSDVLASSNLIVFILAFGLLVSANIFALAEINTSSSSSSVLTRIEITKSMGSINNNRYQDETYYEYSVRVLPILDGEVQDLSEMTTRFQILSTRDFLDPYLFRPEVLKSDFDEFINASLNGQVVEEDLETQVRGVLNATYSIDLEQIPSTYSLGPAYYSASYLVMDKVEDGFWGLVGNPDLLTGRPDDLFFPGIGFNPFDYQEFCYIEVETAIVQPISATTQPGINCYEDIFIISGVFASRDYYLDTAAFSRMEFLFPVSPYFISSMFISLVFYLVVIVLFVLKFFSYFIKSTRLFHYIYSTAPFSFGLLVVGNIVFLFAALWPQ